MTAEELKQASSLDNLEQSIIEAFAKHIREEIDKEILGNLDELLRSEKIRETIKKDLAEVSRLHNGQG